MLDQVVLQTADPLTLNVTAADPNEILVIKSISGLTSTKVGLFTGEYATEGGYYQGRRGEKLTPVITFKLNPNYEEDIEVSDIRQLLYRQFYQPQPGTDGVKVVLKDSKLPDMYFVGYTEDINTDQFAKDQTAQVSMVSMDPYLFSDVLTSAADAAGWSSVAVPYDGTATVGLEATFKINSTTNWLTFDVNGNKMVLNRSFVAGQIVTINTKKGSRAIKLNGTDIMAALTAASPWVQLDRPVNTIKAYGLNEGDGNAVMTAYNFRSRWWGL